MTESWGNGLLAAPDVLAALKSVWSIVQIFVGFSLIIFVHELGHFMVAKWAGVRVEQFAIGFFREVFGFTRGETRYSFNLLPLGGYVKMLGQEDFEVDTTGELQFKDDPRSFANKSVGKRMAIVSAGVIMNILLAGLLFMVVFLVGKQVASPQLGMVVPDSPAALAGLETGDRILSINGSTVDEFNDINMAVMLAKPGQPLQIKALRDGEHKDFFIEPERSVTDDLPRLGITSAQSAVIVDVGPDYDPKAVDQPHVGDRIVQLGGPDGPVVTDENANEMMGLLAAEPLAYSQVIVERPIGGVEALKADDVRTERMTVNLKSRIIFRRVDFDNPPHLLGLAPLHRFNTVKPGGRADLAGVKVGDIIVGWGKLNYPTGQQVQEAILASTLEVESEPERDIPIRVFRSSTGKEERLVLRPRVKKVPLTGKRKPPQIDATFDLPADSLLRVAKVVPEAAGQPTPTAKAGIPAGALIKSINDEAVTTWTDLAERLRAQAGKDVTVTYDTDGQAGAKTTMRVPVCLRTALGVGPSSAIVAIDGEEFVEVSRNNRSSMATVNDPAGLQAILKRHVGKTVAVRYRSNLLDPEVKTADVLITEEMLYPWVGSITYSNDLAPGGQMALLRKANPIDALAVGARKTYYFVVQVYQVMERMIFSRSLGVENISGPVGIVKLGKGMAEKSWIDLLYFLAIISANLAVINFLPLPIVDGGLMVFLIIEKIKGSPISMRVQVATQVVGLILIGSAFAFVTIQDIFR